MKRIFLIITILLPLFVKAQDTISMGLKDCMQYAVEHSTKITIQDADNRDAQVNRRDAILNTFTPEISGNTYAYYNFGRSIDPESNTYSTVTSFHNGYSVSAGIDLFNGFQAVNNMKITKTAQMQADLAERQYQLTNCHNHLKKYGI